MSADFAYLNSRLRAMRARLLPPATMARLEVAPDVPRLLLALAPTAYGQSLLACRGDPYGCLRRALRADALATLAHLRRVCAVQERAFAEAVFAGYDTANVVAVLRGAVAGAPPERTLEALLPCGPLAPEALAAAASARSVPEVAALLARGSSGAAAKLLSIVQHRPDAGPWEIEAALDRWRFRKAMVWVEEGDGRNALREALRLDRDVANVLLAFRLSAEPGARDALAPRLSPAGLASLFATRGRVGPAELTRAAAEPSPAACAAALRDGPYGALLSGATDAVAAERLLRSHRRHRLAALAVADPLGPGMLVGYLAAKEWEWARLRHIGFRVARGQSAADALGLVA